MTTSNAVVLMLLFMKVQHIVTNQRSKAKDVAALRLHEYYSLIPTSASGERLPKLANNKARDKLISDLIGAVRTPEHLKLNFAAGKSSRV